MDLLSRLSGNSKPLSKQKVMSIPEMFSLRFGESGLMLEMKRTVLLR